ncbi:hypothetical protein AWM70_01980 [Paenibacillus yonginensis]|uniref:Hrp-dependent type III effector protein n=1 Tax=Paenibacillus yonginensis TaxID=1462996 RepID=A0A1B1MWE6_9BACL|nr:four-carbon acid sugar kinase family protein [Paenibacillus yonginensis]ANS73503.1 hypothetical protein AWM70_01980 [Paenibacillus yonginensis]
MRSFYIIADDLTGANDAGVQLSKIGIASTVWLDFQEGALGSAGDVAIIDTDSRAAEERVAYERSSKASSILRSHGYEHVYKKMDSTLRGNVAAELAAVVSVHQPEVVVVAPAFPKMNRQTINGYQYVNGRLVSETEFGRDPKTPVTDSSIPNLFKGYVDANRIYLISQTELADSPEQTKRKILELAAEGPAWFICDAATDADLEAVARLFAQTGKRTVWAGSAGLIEQLPAALNLKQTFSGQPDKLNIARTLTVSASLSQVTRRQLEKARTLPDVFFLEMNPADLIRQTYEVQDMVRTFAGNAHNRHFVLFVDPSAENREATKKLEAELSMNKTEISEAISRELGTIARAILQSFPDINGLVLTGGDTAKAVCNRLGMTRLRLYTEVEPGLPLGKMSDASSSRDYWTVTKAGAFGSENSLANVLSYMNGKDE